MTDADLNLLLALLVIGVGIVCAIAIWQARRGYRSIRDRGFSWDTEPYGDVPRVPKGGRHV